MGLFGARQSRVSQAFVREFDTIYDRRRQHSERTGNAVSLQEVAQVYFAAFRNSTFQAATRHDNLARLHSVGLEHAHRRTRTPEDLLQRAVEIRFQQSQPRDDEHSSQLRHAMDQLEREYQQRVAM